MKEVIKAFPIKLNCPKCDEEIKLWLKKKDLKKWVKTCQKVIFQK